MISLAMELNKDYAYEHGYITGIDRLLPADIQSRVSNHYTQHTHLIYNTLWDDNAVREKE